MAGDTVTYNEIFGAEPGQEIQESWGFKTYRACPAALALKRMLSQFTDVFPQKILGGQSNKWDEFNRHHAGLAVDIMLDLRSEPEVILGQNLLLLFMRHRKVMKWSNGIIYQHDLISADGIYHKYETDDHMDHIHVDWHSPSNVDWVQTIETIPWRRKDGSLKQLEPKQKPKIASSIRWTEQAKQTIFEKDLAMLKELNTLIIDHRQKNLSRLVMEQEVSSARMPN